VLSTAETGFASAVCWPSLSAAIASSKRRRWPMDAIPQLAQVLSREAAQNLLIDVVVAERGHISFEPEAAQPSDHIHGSCLTTASVRNHYNLSAVFCPGSVCREAIRKDMTSRPRPPLEPIASGPLLNDIRGDRSRVR